MSAHISESLSHLANLHERGAINDEEFSRAKARVLDEASCDHAGCHPASDIATLRRSRCNRWVAGVCGGLGTFTGVPAWIWRVGFVSSMLFAGTGLLIYVLLWVFMPVE